MSHTARLDHTHGVLRRRARSICALSCLLLLGLAPATAGAAEEETHTFNATLSLNGECEGTSPSIDPVPDPGCPGGTHPPKPFTKHGGVAVDLHGNRYVASAGGALDGKQGRIDIFNSAGEFIDQIEVTLPQYQASLAVDSQGYLYVSRELADTTQRLLRYKPTGAYNPAAGEIEYDSSPVVIPNPDPVWKGEWLATYLPLAINPANDHLFVAGQTAVTELSSAAEGNALADAVMTGGLNAWAFAIAVDSVRKRIYVSDLNESAVNPGSKPVVKVFNLEAPHELLFTIDGSTTPTKRFVSETRVLPIAVDEATGHVFVGDLEAPTRRVYEFDADGNPVSTFGEGRLKATGSILLQLAYDDSSTSSTEGYLFVPSGIGPGRSLAFEPKPLTGPPLVEDLSVSAVTTTDAILHGKVNPGGVETAYRFEYASEQEFLANGFEGATLASEGTLKPASEAIALNAPASGLQPGTAYRFRLVAESIEGEDEAEAGFATLANVETSTNCPNQALRAGPSALLPDCRAYELVTPPDTNARAPFGNDGEFTTRQVSPAGDKVPFRVEGGSLPGLGGTGSLRGDPYLATRTDAGWSTAYTGPAGDEASAIVPGTNSADQGYSFWLAAGSGSAVLEGKLTAYVRYPDGHSEVLAQGSLGIDREGAGKLISEGGGHIVFGTGNFASPATAVQLEPAAAPSGTQALYDRTADGTTHVVSLKPGEVPFRANEHAGYEGASLDGEGIAFQSGGTLYLRYRNEETFAIGTGATFAGVAEGGGRVFYLKGGNLEAFDVEAGVIGFTTSGDVTPVTVASDGSVAYFTSPSVLGATNPQGDSAQAGEQNLYRSVEGQIDFLGTVTDRDVEGQSDTWDGLGLWVGAIGSGRLNTVPARSTPDGSVFLFKSRAALTGYDPEGHAEIYRYDAAGELDCLSCNPTGAAPGSDASLQFESREQEGDPYSALVWPENLRADGRRAFFESAEALVASDFDGLMDVYQWEDQGVGNCAAADGCLALISSGQSGREERLWAVSASGNDVFFTSSDLLAGGDADETPSIYDARVNGGFAPPTPPPGECLGEACQPAAAAPSDSTPASSSFQGAGNVAPESRPRCAKGKRAVSRAGKRRCVPRKHRGAKKQANANRRAGR